jgi:hypothetical protein
MIMTTRLILVASLLLAGLFATDSAFASYGSGGGTTGWHGSGNSSSAPGHTK